MKRIYLLAIIFSLLSCKNEQNEQSTNQEKFEIEQAEKSKNQLGLEVTFNVVVKNDNKIFLRYTEDQVMRYNPKNFIEANVEGKDEPQDIKFTLPKNVIPRWMRVNFESNNMKCIMLNSANFKLENRSLNITKENIWNSFTPTNITSFNKDVNTFCLDSSDAQFLPGFNFRKVLMDQIEINVY